MTIPGQALLQAPSPNAGSNVVAAVHTAQWNAVGDDAHETIEWLIHMWTNRAKVADSSKTPGAARDRSSPASSVLATA